MPFQSEAQRRFMFARHPKIAKRWAHEHPDQGPLPEHVKHEKKDHDSEALMHLMKGRR